MELNYIFGPVPSRRLGFSLGIDIVPFKTCSLDCVYCQLGRTTRKTIRREGYGIPRDILVELDYVLTKGVKIDYITFSGSGEPTLNSNIGRIIAEVKGRTNIPVAVLTNGTMLHEREVRDDLRRADLVIPSLDAGTYPVFRKINRPHNSLSIGGMIEGLICFRNEFKGEIWLEIVFVKGFNDHPDEIGKIKGIIQKVRPEKVHVNTVVRPPAEDFAKGLSVDELQGIQAVLGENCSLVVRFHDKTVTTDTENIEATVLNLIKRRAVRPSDISHSLGVRRSEIDKCLKKLLQEKTICTTVHNGQIYYAMIAEREAEQGDDDKVTGR